MAATISLVAATRPEGLLDAAGQLTSSATHLGTHIGAQRGALADLTANWQGQAATAAQARAETDLARQDALRSRLEAMASTLRSGGTGLSALRAEIQNVASQAAALGGLISDDGTVRSLGSNPLMTPALAAAYTSTLKTLLGQFDAVDQSTANALNGTFGPAPQTPPPEFEFTEEDLYDGDPSSADIDQDDIGDCYLAATMGAIANADPQRIKDRIKYDPATGTFNVTLWDGNQWREIPVSQDDIQANIDAHGASDENGGPLWPAVLESAYANMHAPGEGIEGIESGLAWDAMEALTGNRGEVIIPAFEAVPFVDYNLDQKISNALQSGQPVTVSTNYFQGPLEQAHVYTVESITGTGSDAVVTLRNPWGPDSGPPFVKMSVGDLMGSPGMIPGLGPAASVNIGRM
ncbi:C2 family cysteine protease [Mycobacterium hubeiense]|uniref:C2 family cysteine protease n=1 Tax=Mycobacterium hubeiense TaxID=1867256 RepID=UPI000C7F23BE|nr:C2 family cysteine protease [Mycobacterium sp. QGD 101]